MKRVFNDKMVELYFKDIIAEHEGYKSNWLNLRKLFAENADYLTGTILSIPISMRPDTHSNLETEVYDALIFTGEKSKSLFEMRHTANVFDPWANYWCGTWKTRDVQYHLWDKTIPNSIGYLQVVTQSEVNFVDDSNIASRDTKEVDLAINVSTKENGITGWVNKNSAVRMPHVGYLVNERTLIWLAFNRDESKLDSYDGKWHMFLEWTNNVSSPTRYNIYENSFYIKDGKIDTTVNATKGGCAKYHMHNPGESIKDCKKHTCVP